MPKRPIRSALLASAACLAALALSGSALAESPDPHGGPHGPRGPRGLEALVEQLGLDGTALAAVEEVLAEASARRAESRPRMREAHETMRALMEEDPPDEAAILAQADRVGELHTAARKERIRTLLRVRELLPPDARSRLVELMQARGSRHHRRGGPDW